MRLLFCVVLGLCTLSLTAGEELRVGVNLPLSGDLVSFGKNTLDGIRLEADRINAAGGVGGRTIRLFVEDNRGDSTAAAAACRKLAGTDQVAAMIGPITSNAAKAVRRDALELKLPVISPTATNDQVTRKHPYMFRACFNDSFQGEILARHARDAGLARAGILVDQNSDYSKGLAASFRKAFTAAGGTVAAEENYQQGDTEFGPSLQKIQAAGADLLFVPGYPPEVPLILKKARVLGLKARPCGADGWDNEQIINGSGPQVEGAFLVGAFSREDARPAVQAFVGEFRKTFSREPGTFEALGSDSMRMLAEAVRVKGPGREEIREGLRGLKDFEAVTGKITVTEDGDARKSGVVLEIVRDGERFATRYVATIAP